LRGRPSHKAIQIEISDAAGGGLATKTHAATDEHGLPVELSISPGEMHDIKTAAELLDHMEQGQMPLADQACDAD